MDPLEKQLTDISAPTPGTPLPPEDRSAEFEHEHKGHVAPVRTFSTDLANAVREKGGSVVRIAIAEEEKNRREFKENSISSKKNMVLVGVGVALLIVAAGTLIWAYAYKKTASAPVVVTNVLPPSVIHAESAQVIDTGNLQTAGVIDAIQNIVASPNIQAGTIKNIILSTGSGVSGQTVPIGQLLNSLSSHIPIGLTQALSSDFMLGVYVYDRSSLFLVIHGKAHDFLLSGMLAWEPYLFNDMVSLFNINTSGFTPAQLQNMTFQGTLVENRDARAVLDPGGKPLFFYSFIDQNTILLSTDPKTLTEAVRRM